MADDKKSKSDVSPPAPPQEPVPPQPILEERRIAVAAAQPGGRRRAGFSFGPEPTLIAVADLSPQQMAAIEADPLLSVKDAQ